VDELHIIHVAECVVSPTCESERVTASIHNRSVRVSKPVKRTW